MPSGSSFMRNPPPPLEACYPLGIPDEVLAEVCEPYIALAFVIIVIVLCGGGGGGGGGVMFGLQPPSSRKKLCHVFAMACRKIFADFVSEPHSPVYI